MTLCYKQKKKGNIIHSYHNIGIILDLACFSILKHVSMKNVKRVKFSAKSLTWESGVTTLFGNLTSENQGQHQDETRKKHINQTIQLNFSLSFFLFLIVVKKISNCKMVQEESVRGTVNLAQIRSRSYEYPRAEYIDSPKGNAHFSEEEKTSESLRPNPTRMHTTGQIKSRPKASSRATSFVSPVARMSMVRNFSTFSLYSNFAGERLEDNHSRRVKPVLVDSEKKSICSEVKQDISPYDEESLSEEGKDSSVPKASVGKAMFMFLKAFIGSGVLFLPKA